MDVLVACGLGLALGCRHAFEPDHVSAVSTIVTQDGGSQRAMWVGAWWGLGHSIALAIACVAVATLQVAWPEPITQALETTVGVVLVALGAQSLWLARRGGGRDVANKTPALRSSGDARFQPRSLLVGLLHGLAGSGAMTAQAVVAFPTLEPRVAYIAVFGCGSIVAMTGLSGLLGWPIRKFASDVRAFRVVHTLAGCTSIAIGAAWIGSAVTDLLTSR